MSGTYNFDTSAYDTCYANFLNHVQSYNTLQKKHLYELFSQSLTNILHAYTVPHNTVQSTDNTSVNLPIIESTIAHKLNTMYGDNVLNAFTRFDIKHTGLINQQQLHAITALLGLNLNTDELHSIMNKYSDGGNSTVMNYNSMVQYYEAEKLQLSHSTTSDMYSSILLNRSELSSSERDQLIHVANQSSCNSLTQCMAMLREYCYNKNKNFYQLYKSISNNVNGVTISDLVDHLLSQFTNETKSIPRTDLLASAQQYTSNDMMTYHQFVDFIQGSDSKQANVSDGSVSELTEIIQQSTEPLIKINALNIRKYFKSLDSNMDGLLTVQDIINGLHEHGLNNKYLQSNVLSGWILSFPHKQSDQFSYAEFMQFVQQRLVQSGQTVDELNLMSLNPVAIDSSLSVSDIFSTIIQKTRNLHVSVESVLIRYSTNNIDLNEIELYNGIAALGFVWTNQSCHTLFTAFCSELQSSSIPIHTFVQTLSNPSRLHQFSATIKSRIPAGGESTVPLGSYVDPNMPLQQHKPARKYIEQHECLDEQIHQHSRTHVEPTVKSTIDLSHDDTVTNTPVVQNTNKPVSTFSFHDDPLPATPKSSHLHSDIKNKSSPTMLAFNPETPLVPVPNKRPFTAGGKTSICLTDTVDIPPMNIIPQAIHKTNDIFNMESHDDHTTIPRTSKVIHVNGSKSTVFDADVTVPSTPKSRPQDVTHVFDVDSSNDTPIRTRKAVPDKRKSSVQLAHADMTPSNNNATAPTPRVRKAVDGHTQNHDTSQLIGDTLTSKLIIDSYKNDTVDTIDYELLSHITQAIYAHSQRLKHTFTEFNKSNNTTLSKSNFIDGCNNQLKIKLTDQQATAIYARFDVDHDDAINYSEFVRMLSCKQESSTAA